jgi:hypothetical protein
MVRNFTIALVAALVFGSVGVASARVFAPSITTGGPNRSRIATCPVALRTTA